MPADGIIKIFSTPGDVVNKLNFKVGAPVKAGEILAVMRSEASLASQKATLNEQRRNAEREYESAVKQAELKLSAAELKLKQVQTQQVSLRQQELLLVEGERQVAASEKILERLKSIASDKLTREFVGQLEIERQSLAVSESQIKLSQQRSTSQQAASDLNLAFQAAEAEVAAAKTMLQIATDADPTAAFDAQLNALEAEAGRAVVKAPVDGVILAIHATEGSSAFQSPLIEMASLKEIVVELEVNVSQAKHVQSGQKVTISNESFKQPLTGVVSEKSQVVGKPKLRSLDPMAAVDYRTLSVIVRLDQPEEARNWIQLQVDASIETGPTATR